MPFTAVGLRRTLTALSLAVQWAAKTRRVRAPASAALHFYALMGIIDGQTVVTQRPRRTEARGSHSTLLDARSHQIGLWIEEVGRNVPGLVSDRDGAFFPLQQRDQAHTATKTGGASAFEQLG